jgi:hypothetical protein
MSQNRRSPYNGNGPKKGNKFYSSGFSPLLSRLDKLEHQVFCCGDDTDAVVEVAVAAYTVDSNQDGAFFYLNLAGGITLTLPPATAANVGFNCKIAVKTKFSGTLTIITGSTSDLFEGGIMLVDPITAGDTAFFQPDLTDDYKITADADTKGRDKGGLIDIKITAANRVFVSGTLVGDGTLVTPFA